MFIKQLKIKSPGSGIQYKVDGEVELTSPNGYVLKTITKVEPSNGASELILSTYTSHEMINNHIKNERVITRNKER